MLDVCNDARNKAEVSPQIYNAWGIRYMVYCHCLHHELSTIPLSH